MRKLLLTALMLTLASPVLAGEVERLTSGVPGPFDGKDSGQPRAGSGFFEGFEDAVPPDGWQIVTTNPAGTWEQQADGWALEGNFCARVWNDSTAQDEQLSFEYPIDVAGGEYILSFYMGAASGQTWDLTSSETVEVNGTEVFNFDDEVVYGHHLYVEDQYFVDLSAWDGQTVTIAFRYVGQDGGSLFLDAVMIDDGTGYDPGWPPAPLNDTCESAEDNGYFINYGDFFIDADSTDARRDYSLVWQSCVVYGFTGRDLVWLVDMEEGDVLNVVMSASPWWDEVFWLCTDCSDAVDTCVAHGDEPPNMTYVAEETRTYYLIAGGWSPGREGPFTLTGSLTGADDLGTMIIAGPGPGPDNVNEIHGYQIEGNWTADLEISAYGPNRFGVNVATGDVDGDDIDDILTGPGPGTVFGPQVRGFGRDGNQLAGLSFFAYGTLKYGVNVGAGDLDGDGADEIVTGAGPGAVFGPHVRGWNYDGSAVNPISGISYFAYGTPKWGVNVAAGDFDADGYDEIVTGAGPGAVYGPHVRGWNYDNSTLTPVSGISFLAYGTNKFGVNVACGDIDGDGYAEIITGAGPGAVFGPHVRGWNVDGGTATAISAVNMFAFDYAQWGVNVACGDIDGDGIEEILVGAGPGETYDAWVRAYNYDGGTMTMTEDFTAFDHPDEDITHGVKLAVGQF